MKIFYNLHIGTCIKHFVRVTVKLPEIPTAKEYILTFRISIQTNHLELQIENWKMHEKTDTQICKHNCLPFLEVLRSTINCAVNNIKLSFVILINAETHPGILLLVPKRRKQ